MTQYSWDTAPDETRAQVAGLVQGATDLMRDALVGVYLHGSLAMGSFHPAHSDLDALVMVNRRLTREDRRAFAELLMKVSGQPHPVELSVIFQGALTPWQHPLPYEFHYGDHLRAELTTALHDPAWGEPPATSPLDPDLAAHIVIARERGVTLAGRPVREVLPEVPTDDYIDALLADFEDAVQTIEANPIYGVLNLCRVYWFLLKSAISSKDEAGAWALSYLPEEQRGVVQQALRAYRDEKSPNFTPAALHRFTAYMDEQVRQTLA